MDGFKEFAGYLAVASSALATGLIAARVGRSRGRTGAGWVRTPREVFWRTTLFARNLSSVSQAGLINNLNDGITAVSPVGE